MSKQFHVLAGKYEDGEFGTEENCKYADSFYTFEEALDAYVKLNYPWRRIEFGSWSLEPHRKPQP